VSRSAPLRRIHILGAAGAGKSTLGESVARRIGAVHLDTDDVYWLPSDPPYREKRAVAERIAMLRTLLSQHDRVVLTGSLSGWGDPLVPLLDGLVLLDTPVGVRLGRLAVRDRLRYGASAIHPGGPLRAQHTALMQWAAAYDAGTMPGRSRARDERWIADAGLPVLRLRGDRDVTELADELCRWIAGGGHRPRRLSRRQSRLRGARRAPCQTGGIVVPYPEALNEETRRPMGGAGCETRVILWRR
jgi:adenylate kinase family enzyme